MIDEEGTIGEEEGATEGWIDADDRMDTVTLELALVDEGADEEGTITELAEALFTAEATMTEEEGA